GTGPTVTAAVPFTPSLVAVIVALPLPIAVTTPAPDTVATAGLELLQVTTRPPSAVPPVSSGVATSVRVPPTASVTTLGDTATDATGALVSLTVMLARPATP